MRLRAVAFDLFQTLVPYDSQRTERGYRRMPEGLGISAERDVLDIEANVPGGEARWDGRTVDSLEDVLELA